MSSAQGFARSLGFLMGYFLFVSPVKILSRIGKMSLPLGLGLFRPIICASYAFCRFPILCLAEQIARRRTAAFGHIARLADSVPVRLALRCQIDASRPFSQWKLETLSWSPKEQMARYPRNCHAPMRLPLSSCATLNAVCTRRQVVHDVYIVYLLLLLYLHVYFIYLLLLFIYYLFNFFCIFVLFLLCMFLCTCVYIYLFVYISVLVAALAESILSHTQRPWPWHQYC